MFKCEMDGFETTTFIRQTLHTQPVIIAMTVVLCKEIEKVYRLVWTIMLVNQLIYRFPDKTGKNGQSISLIKKADVDKGR